jgi:hypothetical protein
MSQQAATAPNIITRMLEISPKLDEQERAEKNVFNFFETMPLPAFIEVYDTPTLALKSKHCNKAYETLVGGKSKEKLFEDVNTELKQLKRFKTRIKNIEIDCSEGKKVLEIKEWVDVSLRHNITFLFGVVLKEL